MLLFLRIEQRLGSYSRTSMKCSLKVNLHVTIHLFIFVILCIILMLHNATSNTVPCLEIIFPNFLFFQSLVLLIKSNALIGERAVDHFSEETDSRLAASVNFGQGKY